MFERFSEPARVVVVLAQDEARRLRHNYIGTEHILLGLLREEDGLAARALDSLSVRLPDVRAKVTEIVGEGDEITSGQIPFTPRAKQVMERSLKEALALGHTHIGTEHVLLGLIRVQGVAASVLLELGAGPGKVQNEVIRLLSSEPPPSAAREHEQLASELRATTQAKEAAIEAGEFERAAALRDKERRLRRHLGLGRGAAPAVGQEIRIGGKLPLSARLVEPVSPFFGWLEFGVALGVGILIGWLIWG